MRNETEKKNRIVAFLQGESETKKKKIKFIAELYYICSQDPNHKP